LTHGLGWVELGWIRSGRDFAVFDGLGWVEHDKSTIFFDDYTTEVVRRVLHIGQLSSI